MNKRSMTAALALVTATGALTACGGGSSTASKTTAVKSAVSSAASSATGSSSTSASGSSSSAASDGSVSRITAPTNPGTPINLWTVLNSKNSNALVAKTCQDTVGKPSVLAKELGFTLASGADVWPPKASDSVEASQGVSAVSTVASAEGSFDGQDGEGGPTVTCMIQTTKHVDTPAGSGMATVMVTLHEGQSAATMADDAVWAGVVNPNLNNDNDDVWARVDSSDPALGKDKTQKVANDAFNKLVTKG